MKEINNIFQIQREYFSSQKTKNIQLRIDTLKKLKSLIKNNEEEIIKALKLDLGKSDFEAYATEIGILYEEFDLHIKKLRSWSRPEKRKSPIVYYPSKSYIYKEPYGVSLIIGPFNYPFQLVIAPLIGAISAGNTAIIKPSENTQSTAKLIEKLLNNNFESGYIKVVDPLGGKEVVSHLLDLEFDYIFFTGSVKVGKIVMEKASKHLTPVTLELGGKSPCIVDKDAKLELAAKRIVWGKFINAGQTCVAPDYLLVNESIKDKFLKLLVKEIKSQFGEDINKSPDYPRVVNTMSLDRLEKYLGEGNIYFGGTIDKGQRYMEPTILTDIVEGAKVMEDEIFGPILPVLTFNDLDKTIKYVNNRPKPLALYYFSEDSIKIEKILSSTTSGGVTINDTIIHVANSNIPFGGVGPSGMGNYHGKASFDVFTNEKAVVKRGTFTEFKIRFAPYGDRIKLLRKVMK